MSADNKILSEIRLGLLGFSPEETLQGTGIGNFSRHLQRAFPQLEIFPKKEWIAKHPLANLNLKIWYLNQLKNDFIFSGLLKKLHRNTPFDLLFTLPGCGLFLDAEKLKVPIIELSQGCWIEFVNQTVYGRLDAFIQKLVPGSMFKISSRSKYRTAVSQRSQEEIKRHYGQNCHVIPIGVDTDAFQPRDKFKARQKLSLQEAAAIGLFVGRAETAKGWDMLTDVAKVVRSVTFLCVVEKKVPSPCENILIRQNRSPVEIQSYYNAADFLFLPSRYESASHATLEAMSSNLPVILSNQIGILPNPCPIGSQEGLYRIGGGVQDYIRAIQACLKNPHPPQTRDFVKKNFPLEDFCVRYQQLVTNLLNENGRKSPET